MMLFPISSIGLKFCKPTKIKVLNKIDTCIFANFATDWVAHATKKLDVRSVELARAFADPQHVCTAVIPTASK